MQESIAELLGRHAVFVGLDAAELDHVLVLGERLHVAHKGVIVGEDQAGDACFLLLSGRVNVEMRHPFRGGDPQVMAKIESGEMLGEVSLVDRSARSATCRAIEPVEVLRFDNERLRELMEREPLLGYKIMSNLAKLLAARLRRLNAEAQKNMIDLFYY